MAPGNSVVDRSAVPGCLFLNICLELCILSKLTNRLDFIMNSLSAVAQLEPDVHSLARSATRTRWVYKTRRQFDKINLFVITVTYVFLILIKKLSPKWVKKEQNFLKVTLMLYAHNIKYDSWYIVRVHCTLYNNAFLCEIHILKLFFFAGRLLIFLFTAVHSK